MTNFKARITANWFLAGSLLQPCGIAQHSLRHACQNLEREGEENLCDRTLSRDPMCDRAGTDHTGQCHLAICLYISLCVCLRMCVCVWNRHLLCALYFTDLVALVLRCRACHFISSLSTVISCFSIVFEVVKLIAGFPRFLERPEFFPGFSGFWKISLGLEIKAFCSWKVPKKEDPR